MALTEPLFEADLDRRFGGLARLYGVAGAQRIREAHIVVVGIGGVGSWAAEAAARSGVARLTLVDLDHIAESNINRQIHALDGTLGQSKVQAMQERIAQINPHCQVVGVEDFVDPDNWPSVIGWDASWDRTHIAVIDACDQVKAKTAMAAWAIRQKVNFVSIGAAGGKRLAHRVDVEDLADVTHDPLLAQLRYRLRKEHGGARKGRMGVTCVFSREPVLQPAKAAAPAEILYVAACEISPATDGTLNCHGYGSVVSVTATFGMCATGWALSKIAA